MLNIKIIIVATFILSLV